MEALLIVSAMFAVGVVGWYLAAASGRSSLEHANALARRLALTVRAQRFFNLTYGIRLDGEVHGRRVRFWSYATGSGKSQQTWAAVAVSPRQPGGLEFKLSRQGFATGVQRLFGAKEITVDDGPFDDAWFVQTNRPEFLAAALVPEIRQKLLAVHRAGGDGGFRVDGGDIVYAERGSLGSSTVLARLESALPVLEDLADVSEVAATAS